jgi:hypothetical protein
LGLNVADERTGIKTAIAEVAEAVNATEPEAADEQLPLLSLPMVQDEQAAPRTATGKPGRPPGARNKSTEEWKHLFLTKYRSPLFAAGELYSRPVEQLAADLGLDWARLDFDQKVRLLTFQRDTALGVMPFVHSKQPLAVQVDSKGIVQVILSPVERESTPQPGDRAADAGDRVTVIDNEENQ